MLSPTSPCTHNEHQKIELQEPTSPSIRQLDDPENTATKKVKRVSTQIPQSGSEEVLLRLDVTIFFKKELSAKQILPFDEKRAEALKLFDTWAKDFYSKLGWSAGAVFYVQWSSYQSAISNSQNWEELATIFKNDKETIASYQEYLDGEALESLKQLEPTINEFLTEYAPE